MLNLFFAYIGFYATKNKDATDASVEWGFAKEVKLTRPEPFVQEIARSPARSRHRTQGFCRPPVSRLVYLERFTTLYTPLVSIITSLVTAIAAVPIAWFKIHHLVILVTSPVAT